MVSVSGGAQMPRDLFQQADCGRVFLAAFYGQRGIGGPGLIQPIPLRPITSQEYAG